MKYTESLKKYGDFRQVYQKGKSFANRSLVMYVYENKSCGNRIGISVSKKVGNSVVRHRVTRLIRESCRLNEERFVRGLDVVIVARPGAKELGFFAVERALLHLAGLHRILITNNENAAAGGPVPKESVKNTDEKGFDPTD